MRNSRQRNLLIMLLLLIPAVCLIRAVHFRFMCLEPFDIIWVRLQQYNEKNEHTRMVRAYKTLTEKYPSRTDLLYPLGWAYYKTGHYAEARSCMRRFSSSAF